MTAFVEPFVIVVILIANAVVGVWQVCSFIIIIIIIVVVIIIIVIITRGFNRSAMLKMPLMR